MESGSQNDLDLDLGGLSAGELADLASSHVSRRVLFHTDLDMSSARLDELVRLLHQAAVDRLPVLQRFVHDVQAREPGAAVIWLLTQLLTLYTEPADDVGLCLLVLDSLCTDQPAEAVVRQQTVGVVLGSMAALHHDRDVQYHGSRILARLAHCLPPEDKKASIREAAAEILLQSLIKFEDDIEIVEPCVRTIVEASWTLYNVSLDALRADDLRTLHRDAVVFVCEKCKDRVRTARIWYQDSSIVQAECQRFEELLAKLQKETNDDCDHTAESNELNVDNLAQETVQDTGGKPCYTQDTNIETSKLSDPILRTQDAQENAVNVDDNSALLQEPEVEEQADVIEHPSEPEQTVKAVDEIHEVADETQPNRMNGQVMDDDCMKLDEKLIAESDINLQADRTEGINDQPEPEINNGEMNGAEQDNDLQKDDKVPDDQLSDEAVEQPESQTTLLDPSSTDETDTDTRVEGRADDAVVDTSTDGTDAVEKLQLMVDAKESSPGTIDEYTDTGLCSESAVSAEPEPGSQSDVVDGCVVGPIIAGSGVDKETPALTGPTDNMTGALSDCPTLDRTTMEGSGLIITVTSLTSSDNPSKPDSQEMIETSFDDSSNVNIIDGANGSCVACGDDDTPKVTDTIVTDITNVVDVAKDTVILNEAGRAVREVTDVGDGRCVTDTPVVDEEPMDITESPFVTPETEMKVLVVDADIDQKEVSSLDNCEVPPIETEVHSKPRTEIQSTIVGDILPESSQDNSSLQQSGTVTQHHPEVKISEPCKNGNDTAATSIITADNHASAVTEIVVQNDDDINLPVIIDTVETRGARSRDSPEVSKPAYLPLGPGDRIVSPDAGSTPDDLAHDSLEEEDPRPGPPARLHLPLPDPDNRSESSSSSLDMECTRLQLRRTTYCVSSPTNPAAPNVHTPSSESSLASSVGCCHSHELNVLSDIDDDSLEKSAGDSFQDCASLDEDSYSLSDCCSESHDAPSSHETPSMPPRSASCPGLDQYYDAFYDEDLADDLDELEDEFADEDVPDTGSRRARRGWGSIHPPDVEGLLSHRTPSMIADSVEDAHKFRRLHMPPSQSEPDIVASLERRAWDPMPLNELLYLEEKSLESRSEMSSGTSQCSEADEEGIIDYLLSQPHGYIVQLLVCRTQVLLYVLGYWNRKRYLTVFDILGRPVMRVLEDVRLPTECADFARSRQTETVHTAFVSVLDRMTHIDCMTNKMKQKMLAASEKLLVQPLTPSLTVKVCACTEDIFRKWKSPDRKSVQSLMTTISKLQKDDDLEDGIVAHLNHLLAVLEQSCEK